MAFNREMDAQSLQNERRSASLPSQTTEWTSVEDMPLAGKKLNEWMVELDVIAREVEAELVSREIGCDLVEVLDAVNMVLFNSRGFKRSSVLVDSKCAYMHSVLRSGHCSGISLISLPTIIIILCMSETIATAKYSLTAYNAV